MNDQNIQSEGADLMLEKLNEIIVNHMIDIAKQKSDIFIKRLHDLGIDANLEEEKNRRFKKFQKEIVGNEETIYYNDGSIDGLRIITFKVIETSEPNIMKSETTYY